VGTAKQRRRRPRSREKAGSSSCMRHSTVSLLAAECVSQRLPVVRLPWPARCGAVRCGAEFQLSAGHRLNTTMSLDVAAALSSPVPTVMSCLPLVFLPQVLYACLLASHERAMVSMA
jgi:hypothetical protein